MQHRNAIHYNSVRYNRVQGPWKQPILCIAEQPASCKCAVRKYLPDSTKCVGQVQSSELKSAQLTEDRAALIVDHLLDAYFK